MSQKQDSVVFLNVARSYSPQQDLHVCYQRDAELKTSSRDWVGLFRVGWSSSRDYYTFEWTPPVEEGTQATVIFAGRRLPPEDGHFYQLCYVTREGTVRGASPPFQFTSSADLGELEDLELVEVADEGLTSMMVLQRKSSVEVERLKQNCEVIQEELASVRATLSQTEGVRQTLAGKLEEKEKEKVTLEGVVKESEGRITQLERQLQEKEKENITLEGVGKERQERIVQLEHQLQVVRESEQRLMEKLDRERAQNHELLAARSDTEGQLSVLQQQIQEQQDELGAVGQELEDARRQLKIREAQVEDLEQLASARNDDTERLSEELHQVTQQLEEQRMIVSDLQISAGERQTQLEKAQQDLCAAQENVVELMGARNFPTEQQQLPTNVVDRSVHEALQQAYENMERYYVRVNGQLKGSQETIQVLVAKNNELVARVEQCRKEFEAKASECVELQRQLKRGGGEEVGDEVGALRQRVRELEEGQEEVQQSCAIAVQELTARQEESKQQQERIVELEQKLAQLQRDYEDLEDKHDRKLHEKNDTLEHQQKALDEKVAEVSAVREEKARLEGELRHLQEEKGKLERTVHQLRRQIEATRATGKAKEEGMRACPVCNTRFPARIGQADFERHVQGHFD